MFELPIEATPSQQFLVTLDDQNCTVNLYQRRDRIYMDLLVDNEEVLKGAVCLARVPIVQKATSLFDGNFCFFDLQGANQGNVQDAPEWHGLGKRFRMFYFSEDEMTELAQDRWTRALDEVAHG